MTNDLTIKQAVGELKAMKKHIEPYMSVVGVVAYDMAIKALGQTRWIPISERLPEEHMYCLITVEITPYDCSSSYEVQTSWFDGRNFIYNTYIDDHIVAKRSVIAWMPLPEPYKAESEDEK